MKKTNFETSMMYANKAGCYQAYYEGLVNTIRGFSGTEVASSMTGNEMIDLLIGIIEEGE